MRNFCPGSSPSRWRRSRRFWAPFSSTAGAQMKDITVKDALDELVASIDKFYEE